MLNLIMNYLINVFLPGRCSQREPKLKLLRLMQSKRINKIVASLLFGQVIAKMAIGKISA